MTIDLSGIGNGHELNHYERNVLISNHLCREIIKSNQNGFNYLIISMKTFNLIENSPMFKKNVSLSSNMIWFIGNMGNFDVYVDMIMEPDTILMRYDKRLTREKKLNQIFNDDDTNTHLYIDVVY